jgi:hypothetical protein
MAQETLYFPHDYDPLSDPKLGQFVRKHGAVGYAVYWRTVEMLHQNSEHKLPFKQYVYDEIAEKLSVDAPLVESLLEECVSKYDLFVGVQNLFWSERVFKNVEKRKLTIKQKSEAGKASADARKRLKELADAHPELLEEIEHPLNTR